MKLLFKKEAHTPEHYTLSLDSLENTKTDINNLESSKAFLLDKLDVKKGLNKIDVNKTASK